MDIGNPILDDFNENTITTEKGQLKIIRCKLGLWEVKSTDPAYCNKKAMQEFLIHYFKGDYDKDELSDLIAKWVKELNLTEA